MSWQDLIHDIPHSRLEVGARDAFVLLEQDEFYMVEKGHMDLFAVVIDAEESVLTRKPFVARFEVGEAVFCGPIRLASRSSDSDYCAFQVVPSQDTVVIRGKREHLASPDSFDLDAVSLIDTWVAKTSELVVRHNRLLPRKVLQLEADPDVPYEAHSAVSAHHRDILWVTADQSVQFIGHPDFAVDAGVFLALSEHLWLDLPQQTRISAVHTPGAIVTGKLWQGLDQHSAEILRFAELVFVETCEKEDAQRTGSGHHKSQLREAMIRDLGGLLGDARPNSQLAHGHRSALHAAVAIVAETSGAKFFDASYPLDETDPLDAAEGLVKPSGIYTRRIELFPGWERKDGPSFLGMVSDEEPRPVAVVNTGRGVYRTIDPVSGEMAPVDRKRAELLGTQGVVFYPPLAESVETALQAILQALTGRGRDMFGVALMGGLGALIALLTPILTGQLLAEIIPRVDLPMWISALAAVALGAFAAAAFSVVGAFCMLRMEARIDETLQASIWNRLLSLPLPFFRRYLAADLADRANGVSASRQLLTGAASNSLVSGVFSVFSFFLLFYYSWELALWAALAVSVLAVGSWFCITRQTRHQRAVLVAQGAIHGLVFQMILGLSKIRQANAELNALHRWSERYAEQRRELLSARKWAAGHVTFNTFFEPASMLMLLALIWYSLLQGGGADRFALADFLSFQAAFAQFVGGIGGLTAAWAALSVVIPLFERVSPIIEARPESTLGGIVLPDVSGRIECEHVTFRYPSTDRDVLQGISFHIRPGEYVAFLGPSGAGKSTLYRLLLGFERPTSGSVLLDGNDLLSLDLRAMRRNLGVVLQNGQLVPDSIFKIISGEASLTESEAMEAARMVGLDEDIEAMPMGLHTVLSEGGVGLSGGQKQRLLVARALARNPRLLLFDEATSMLDNRTQDIIRLTLRRLPITRVVIAHRLSTVVDVDRIYVMQDGRIVETGGFQELLDKDGVLAEMARRQLV
ncbi:MAG: NHLP bacteriocin export ABC transporter permease/ATPase subunit [Deltaproteobacteria bacterium]|nr:NHLP bacteriocin export ABC transporter permease/ATPase subunit [Deltaproteobacteria bacterium]